MDDYWTEYEWILVAGCFVAFLMSYGIGANDFSNAFATSVGSKTLNLFSAILLAAVFEFLGAVALGRRVTETISKDIVDADEFKEHPEVLMFGMLCALAAASLWLLAATYLELPVSTTHSIIGGIVGFALVSNGSSAVNWHRADGHPFPFTGVTSLVMSWAMSPIISGLAAVLLYVVTRALVLRADRSYERAIKYFPGMVFIAVFISAFYMSEEALASQWNRWGLDSFFNIQDHTLGSVVVAGVVSAVFSLGSLIWIWKFTRLGSEEGEQVDAVAMRNLEENAEPNGAPQGQRGTLGGIAAYVNARGGVLKLDEATRDMYECAEVFDCRTEGVFRYFQVFTSICDAIAHGANDVANSAGPLATIWHIYRTSGATLQCDSQQGDVPLWIFFIGGFGMVSGLAMYGYSITKAIGVKLAKITASRGCCIELGSALVVVTGSYLKLPLSTTQCQVGATAAVGLLEGRLGISWPVLIKSVAGWCVTMVVVGSMSATLMALGIYSPNIHSLEAMDKAKLQVLVSTSAVISRANVMCPGGREELQAAVTVLNGTTMHNYAHPLRVADSIAYMGNLSASLNSAEAACVVPMVDSTLHAEYDENDACKQKNKS